MGLTVVAMCLTASAFAQQYDIVLRGGRVIDPANGIDARDGRRGDGRPHRRGARQHPGLRRRARWWMFRGSTWSRAWSIFTSHVFGYEGSLVPDETALPAGTTTIVDAGGSGWRTFDEFRRTVIAHSKTRVLALLNIVGKGMVGEPYESDVDDMDPAKTADTILRNKDVIVGIKTAHFAKPGWAAIDRAVEAGKRASVPVMVDDKIFTNAGRTTKEELLEHLRPGDIHTHMYNDRQIELIDRFTGKVQPWMIEARQPRRAVRRRPRRRKLSVARGDAGRGPGISCPIPSAPTCIRARIRHPAVRHAQRDVEDDAAGDESCRTCWCGPP